MGKPELAPPTRPRHIRSLEGQVPAFTKTSAGDSTARDLKREQEDLLDTLWRRHPGFDSAENLSREALHERR